MRSTDDGLDAGRGPLEPGFREGLALRQPPGSTPGVSAARRYQEIIDGLTAAAAEVERRDHERAAELTRRLVELDAAMAHAHERAALSRLAVQLRWEAALEALWPETWFTLRPWPDPDLTADPTRLDELDAEADRAATELLAAVRRRVLRLRR